MVGVSVHTVIISVCIYIYVCVYIYIYIYIYIWKIPVILCITVSNQSRKRLLCCVFVDSLNNLLSFFIWYNGL